MFPGDDGYPGRGTTNGKMAQFAPRVGAIWTPGGDGNTSVRAGVGRLLRHAAPVLQHALRQQPAVGRADHDPESRRRLGRSVSGLSRRQSVPGAEHRTGRRAVPGVRRLRQCAARHRAHGAAAVERQRAAAVRRLDAVGDATSATARSHLWRATELNPAVFAAGATTGNTNQRRVLILQNPVAGPVLRHDRSGRRHRPRQLPRPAAVGAAPPEEQPQRAVQLDDLEVHVGSGDDGDHRADDRRSEQPRSRLLATARRIAGTSSTSRRSSRDAGVRQRRGQGGSSATGSSRRWSAGRAATARRSRPASTTR